MDKHTKSLKITKRDFFEKNVGDASSYNPESLPNDFMESFFIELFFYFIFFLQKLLESLEITTDYILSIITLK